MKKAILVGILSLCVAASAFATCQYLTFITESLPGFWLNEPASFQIEVWGGTAPYTFQLVDGSFPSGLSIDSSGVISGTPTQQTWDHTVWIKVTDANGCHLTQAYAVYVD